MEVAADGECSLCIGKKKGTAFSSELLPQKCVCIFFGETIKDDILLILVFVAFLKRLGSLLEYSVFKIPHRKSLYVEVDWNDSFAFEGKKGRVFHLCSWVKIE